MSLMRRVLLGMTGAGTAPIDETWMAANAVAYFHPGSLGAADPMDEWLNAGTGGANYDLDQVIGGLSSLIQMDTASVHINGTSGNYFSTPDSVTNSITGDIDIRIRVKQQDWTPPGTPTLVAKQDDSATGRSWAIIFWTAGTILMASSTDGTPGAQVTGISSVGTGFTDGSGPYWLRVTLDVDDGSGNRVYKFYTSSEDLDDSEDVTWSQLGTTVTEAGTTSISDLSQDIEIGSTESGTVQRNENMTYRCQIYDGIDGTLAMDFNPADSDAGVSVGTDTWVSSSAVGETWTVHGNAYVNNTGYTGMCSLGSVGIETTASQTIASATTIYLVLKTELAPPSASQTIFDSRDVPAERQGLEQPSGSSYRYQMYGESPSIILAEAYDNELRVITCEFTQDANATLTVSDVGTITGNVGAEGFDFGALAANAASSSTTPGLYMEWAIFAGSHDAATVASVQTYLADKYTA